MLRNEKGLEPLPAVPLDVALAERGTLLEDHVGLDRASEHFIGDADDRGLPHAGEIVEHRLDLLRHLAGGGVCRAKSNQMTSPAVVANKVTMGGKGNYSCAYPDGTTTGQGNLNLIATAEDWATSGAGADKFRIQATGQLNMPALV